jgi:hypothetical protein
VLCLCFGYHFFLVFILPSVPYSFYSPFTSSTHIFSHLTFPSACLLVVGSRSLVGLMGVCTTRYSVVVASSVCPLEPLCFLPCGFVKSLSRSRCPSYLAPIDVAFDTTYVSSMYQFDIKNQESRIKNIFSPKCDPNYMTITK